MANSLEKASRFVVERAREAVPSMFDPDEESAPVFPALQWMTAALFVAAGAESAIRGRRSGGGAFDPLLLAPLVAAPLAAAVHSARALTSAPRARLATRILDGVAAGVAVAGVARAAYDAFAEGGGSPGRLVSAVAPLTFGATALLGLLLEHEEEREWEEHRRLRRRASVVERLVPRRGRKLDHIVVHV